MTRARRARQYEHLTVPELQERLSLARLEWLRAHSWGMDGPADEWRDTGQRLVSEHLLRGIDPNTGKPFRTTG